MATSKLPPEVGGRGARKTKGHGRYGREIAWPGSRGTERGESNVLRSGLIEMRARAATEECASISLPIPD